MKNILSLILVMIFCMSYQSVNAQNSEEDVAKDILEAYKEKNVDLLKKQLTGLMIHTVKADFFEGKDEKIWVQLAQEWDGKIRDLRYEKGELMGKKVIMASAYFSDAPNGEINVVTMTTTDGETWKALAYGMATANKREYESMPSEIASGEGSVKTDHSRFAIEMANGEIVKAPTTEKLKELLGTLNDDNFFLILNSPKGFLQASTSDKGFVIQYSENESMFEAEAYFSKEKMLLIFEAYIDGGDWKSQTKWGAM